jgi:hypothetical protein
MKFEERLNRLWNETDFMRLLPKAIFAAAASPGFVRFFRTRARRSASGEENRRKWLLALGLGWLVGLLPLIGLALLSHFSSYLNLWTWLWAPARAIEPPLWILQLGDARPESLLFCSFFGFLSAVIIGGGGLAWIAAPALLFPGIISLPGAWALILAERLALWARVIPLLQPRRDLLLRFAIALAMWIFLLIFGPALRDWIQFHVTVELLGPETRLVQWVLGLALLTALETAAALVIFHFYFAWTSQEEGPASA